MENPAFEFVREILRSPLFLQQSIDEQQAILDKILETGEITRQELFNVISQEEARLRQPTELENRQPEKINRDAQLLNSLDYNTFLTFILTGNIKGKHLITLCNTSRKLNEYCNRSFQPLNNQGQGYGQAQSQWLFRLLLDRMGIPLLFGRTPKQTYIDKTIGGRVLAFGENETGQSGLGRIFRVNVPTIIPDLEDNIIQVNAGSNFSLCLTNKGNVWGFGNNALGQLAIMGGGTKLTPDLIWDSGNIIQVSSGFSHFLFLDTQGRVWGNNIGGNGLGPYLIPGLEKIIQVSCGARHSLCLDQQGRVWAFGDNQWGKLGLGDNVDRNVPTLIPNFDGIVQVAAGGYRSHCLDDQGRVWSFGANASEQLGFSDDFIANNSVPKLIPNFNGIVQISAGGAHTLCLDNQGRVWGFGSNNNGALGLEGNHNRVIPTLNPNLNNIIQVSAGQTHSLCLDNQNAVWAFGNGDGRLGLGDLKNNVFKPTQISNLYRVIQVSAGTNHSLCIQRK